MQVKVIFIGKTKEEYIETGISVYEKRLKKYFPFQIKTIPVQHSDNSNTQTIKLKEAIHIMSHIKTSDFVVLLDEGGKQFTSIEFARQMQKFMNTINSNLVFIAGGAYGFEKKIYDRANLLLSLSKLTFSHQMVRLFF